MDLQPKSNAVKPWYAVRVKPNYEKPVAAALRGRGYEEFLPLVSSKKQWSDRVKTTELPLFPGYVFCRVNLEDRLSLVTTPGFLYLVGVGKTPLAVEEGEILGIQRVLRSGMPVMPYPDLVIGQKVELQQGPLQGVQGVIASIDDRHRFYVSVTLLQRSISVEVEPRWVKAVDSKVSEAQKISSVSEQVLSQV